MSAPLQHCSGDAQRQLSIYSPEPGPSEAYWTGVGHHRSSTSSYRMHFEWNGAFGNLCFERRFRKYISLSYFSTTLLNGSPEGLCSCILIREEVYRYQGWVHGRVLDMPYFKNEFFVWILPLIPPRPDGSWPSLQAVKEFQEYVAVTHLCSCTISSSEEVPDC